MRLRYDRTSTADSNGPNGSHKDHKAVRSGLRRGVCHIVTGVNAPVKAMFSLAQQGGKFALTGPGLPAISSTANRWWERKIRISGHDVGMWEVGSTISACRGLGADELTGSYRAAPFRVPWPTRSRSPLLETNRDRLIIGPVSRPDGPSVPHKVAGIVVAA